MKKAHQRVVDEQMFTQVTICKLLPVENVTKLRMIKETLTGCCFGMTDLVCDWFTRFKSYCYAQYQSELFFNINSPTRHSTYSVL